MHGGDICSSCSRYAASLPVRCRPLFRSQNLFVLAGQDPSKEIRKRVCQAFVLLLDSQYALLAPHIEQVIQFMLAASNDDDEGVCLEACEFWSAYCEIKQLDVALLRKYLDHLIPILLKAMCYSADELGMLGEEDDEGRWHTWHSDLPVARCSAARVMCS